MSMTAPLGLAVTPRVNESRLSVSRRAVPGQSAGMVAFTRSWKEHETICVYPHNIRRGIISHRTARDIGVFLICEYC